MAFISPTLTTDWLQDIRRHGELNAQDEPNFWVAAPESLVTTSKPSAFSIGTGTEIISSILPECLSTQHELIIVTCFWAKSSSQETIATLLLKLSAKAIAQHRKIQVRLCFSSRSFIQKVFQTTSLNGKIYPASSWINLGLPPPERLQGLELVVKSVFVRPFSVMHPKFILVDRKLAFMPSCNVSWEEWFEGCIELEGEFAGKLFEFWNNFWARGGASLPAIPNGLEDVIQEPGHDDSSGSLSKHLNFKNDDQKLKSPITTILLPSPHHQNPQFHLFFSSVPPPPTPLNAFLLRAIYTAKESIYIQTPNLTCFPVISALFTAIERGVDVNIVTSRRLMILEQLVTAGTITEFELWKLERRYTKLVKAYYKIHNSDPENGMLEPGRLKMAYFHPKEGVRKKEGEMGKSHLKLTIVDEEVTVLGSGNLDRASWYTSQELGVAFISKDMAREVKGAVSEALEGRCIYWC